MLDVAAIVEAHSGRGRETTHWGDCHLSHPRCAILVLAREIARLRDRANE